MTHQQSTQSQWRFKFQKVSGDTRAQGKSYKVGLMVKGERRKGKVVDLIPPANKKINN